MCFQYVPIIIFRLFVNAVSTMELIYWHIGLTLSVLQMKYIITLKPIQVKKLMSFIKHSLSWLRV